MEMVSHELKEGTLVRSMSSWYEIESERSLYMDGHKVLYSLGRAVTDNACCGVFGCRFAVVHGFCKTNYGNAESGNDWEIERISDAEWRGRVSEAISHVEKVHQVQFL